MAGGFDDLSNEGIIGFGAMSATADTADMRAQGIDDSKFSRANDPNESELHERLAAAIGRSEGNPLHVISQKSLTGHAKGGAAAFQVIGLCQVLREGVIPANRSLDCVDPAMEEYPHLVWHRTPLALGPIKAGLVTSLGFGHVAGLLAIAHPEVFVAALPDAAAWREASRQRQVEGGLRLARTMLGEPGLVRRSDRRLGEDHPRELEANLLLDETARLGEDGVFACQ